jgi:hypothetical protein
MFMSRKYTSIDEARKACQSLGINTGIEYKTRYKEDPKLPANPFNHFKSVWTNWYNYLGVDQRQYYLTLAEAKSAARNLGATNFRQYSKLFRLDPLLPSNPERIYRDDWTGYSDFFGDKNRYYRNLKLAAQVVSEMGINSYGEYLKKRHLDKKLPRCPWVNYAKDWISMPKFLGRDSYKFYSTLREAKLAVQALGIISKTEYSCNYYLDELLPSHPSLVYKKEWLGWYDFLGNKKKKYYPTLSEAKEAARSFEFSSQTEYRENYSKDPRLPSTPNVFYADEWKGWKEFLDKIQLYKCIKESQVAARKLGIKTSADYVSRYREDPRLPSNPTLYHKSEWVDWDDFLGRTKYYETLMDASKAAIKLNIKSSIEYNKKRHKDRRLCASPDGKYRSEWRGWARFLGLPNRSCYKTIEEASISAQKLGIKKKAEYDLRYKEDPKLPASPCERYKKNWICWALFLGFELPNLYKSLHDAKQATISLGITSYDQYIENHKRDPRLPARPSSYYKDWNNWTDFFTPSQIHDLRDLKQYCKVKGIKNSKQYRESRGIHSLLPSKPEKMDGWVDWYDALDIPRPYSYKEITALVRKQGIRSLKEYSAFRIQSEDTKLPVKPEEHYQGKGWINTYDFWGIPRPYQVKYFTEDWKLWAEKITEFLKTARGGDTKAKDLCEFVREYIEPNNLENCPLEFLTRKSTNIQPMLDLLEQVPVTRKKKWIYSINEFLDWVILNYLIIEDEETGEITHIKGAKNPLGHVNYNGEPTIQSVSETNKLALPYQYVKGGREWIFPSDSMTKRLNFSDLAHLHNFPADWLLVDDESLLDKKDPDCVWKVEDGKTYLWLPIYWTYTYSLMQLPARGIQIVYCDSGEADSEVADFKNGQVIWKKNKTKLAGLTVRQGMVSKSGKDEFGVHYTSNKTKFDGSGYTIPFMPIELAYWLIKLRKWQQKYNPIKEPTKWLDCERTNLNEIQRKQKGINCFLFRGYREQEPGVFGGRLTSRLAAALFLSSKSDYTTATYRGLSYSEAIEELRDNTQIALSRFKSPYTPHSMRVSLINAYAYEFGIPLEVIMKLVGHSSIIMTIYYTKSDKTGANLREKMEVGEKEAMSKATQTLKSFVEQQRIEEVKSQLVGSSVDLLNTLDNARPASSYLWKDFGICPVGGAFCSEGGCPVATKANIYHPVPAGYLGEQNCFQCRFFITGPAFLVGLTAIFNEISLAVNTQSIRYTSLEQEIDNIAEKIDVIDHQLYKIKADSSEKSALESDRRKLVGQRMHLNSAIETRAKKLDLYLSDMNAIHRHIHNCQTLMRAPKENTENHYQLIVPHEFTLDVELDEVSNFHQLSEVCSNAELYHSCSDDLAVTRRSQIIDKMMFENGIQPQLFLLSEEEQLFVGNQLTELMLARLKGWENVDRLMDGSLTLKDLSIDNNFDEKTIRELFEKSKPLKRIG